jgi:hypothetical protein
MKSTTFLDTQALERVFSEELNEKKHQLKQQRTFWFGVFFVSNLLLVLYLLTPLYTIIR